MRISMACLIHDKKTDQLWLKPYDNDTSIPVYLNDDADTRQWKSLSIQLMTCRKFDNKSLPEPMLISCQFHPFEQA